MISLTEEERYHFAAWLIQEALSNEEMAKQMQALPNMEAMIKKYNTEAMACRVVAHILTSTETDTI